MCIVHNAEANTAQERGKKKLLLPQNGSDGGVGGVGYRAQEEGVRNCV